MHLALRGYLFVVLTALLGVAGTWSDDPAFSGAWLFPAFLLLAGLAAEAWYLRGTKLSLAMGLDGRLKLGRAASGAFVFEHNRGRDLTVQYVRMLPRALRQSTDVREVVLPAEEVAAGLEPAPLLLQPLRDRPERDVRAGPVVVGAGAVAAIC